MVTPIISFNHNHFTDREWVDQKAADIADIAEKLRVAVKQAIGYWPDNSNFIFEDAYGTPALKLHWEANADLSTWSVRTNCSTGNISAAEWDANPKLAIENLKDWAEKAAKGMAVCSTCGKWVNAFKKYSYAGSVCLECFDPKKHKHPDTTGD